MKWLTVLLMLCSAGAWAADTADDRAEDRKALLKVFDEIVKGINEQSIDRMTAQMDKDATVIWLNAEASRGHGEIKGYYHRMVSPDGRADAILKKYTTTAKVAAPARFIGDVAVADGVMADEFFPIKRGPFKLNSNWSVTCIKRDGQWKVVHLHLSSNVFNNELLDEVKLMVWYGAAGGALGGILLVLAFCWLRKRRSRA
jgi:hypothetical protein